MQKMVANSRIPYGLNHVEPGESFEAHDHDVAALEHTGLARLQKVKRGGSGYQTKVLTAQSESKAAARPIDKDPEPVADPLSADPADADD